MDLLSFLILYTLVIKLQELFEMMTSYMQKVKNSPEKLTIEVSAKRGYQLAMTYTGFFNAILYINFRYAKKIDNFTPSLCFILQS